MPYGTVKVDNVTFTNNSVDATTTFSGIYASITNNLTLSGTATAATFTGTTANFTNVNAQNISVTTSLSGLAITGGTAGFTTITGTTVTGTTANFATLSGTTVTGTTANFVTVSGTTVTGNTGQFTNLAGAAAGFTTVTGTTVTGTTANFVTVSGTSITGGTAGFTTVTGTTVTGTTANFVTLSGTTVTGNIGQFTSLTGATTTMTSGVFALGTAPLPSISFVSDPNTGIYSPGADQLAVATNGTRRLLIDSAGALTLDTGDATIYGVRVGRGAGASASNTAVGSGALAANTTGTNNVANGYLALYLNTTGAFNTAIGTSTLSNNTTADSNTAVGNWAGIRIISDGDVNQGIMAFFTSASNVSAESSTERLRLSSTGEFIFKGAGTIPGTDKAVYFSGSAPANSVALDSSGRLGIGASDPQRPLDVVSDASAETVTFRGASANNISTLRFNSYNASTSYASIQSRPAYFEIATAASVPLLLVPGAGTGVGIGTSDVKGTLALQHGNTSPQGLTDVAIDALRISQGVGGIVAIRATQYDAGNQPAAGDTQFFNLYFNGSTYNYYERMRIRADGRVGIGTTSAGHALQVNGAICATGAFGTASANTCTLDASSGRGRVIVSGPDASTYSSLAFGRLYSDGSGYTETARFDASGRLLVGTVTTSYGAAGAFVNRTTGTSNPGSQFRGGGWTMFSISAEPALVLSSNINTAGAATSAETARGGIGFEFVSGAEPTRMVIGIVGTPTVASPLTFWNESERMRIKADGDVSIVTGNLIIGTAGKGIDFSATANSSGTMTSELLNDYEEGTWTPTINTTNNDATITYTNQTAYYRKVGALVFVGVWLEFRATSIGTGGNLFLRSLPFAMPADAVRRMGAAIGDANGFVATNPNALIYLETDPSSMLINVGPSSLNTVANMTLYLQFSYSV